MRCVLYFSLVLIGLGFAVGLAGCAPSAAKGPAPKPAESAAKALPEGLAELSEADRALAEKQKVCPVSGELLGSMGKPVKLTVKERTVFLCCAGCEAAIKKDPDKYLAKLDAAAKK